MEDEGVLGTPGEVGRVESDALRWRAAIRSERLDAPAGI